MLRKISLKQVLIYALYFTIPLLFISNVLDNDIWFQLNHGREILANGFGTTEIFTVHEGWQFSYEKWLTCVIFYLAYSKFGNIGILAVIYILAIMFELIVYAIFINSIEDRSKALRYTMIISTLLFLNFARTRPQMFSFVLLVLEYYLIEKYIKTNKTGYLYLLPVIACVYMQLHSTMMVMFFIVLLPYIVRIKFKKIEFKERNYRILPIIVSGTLSFIAAFINPYGARSVFYLFNSSGLNLPIKELEVPGVISVIYIASFVVLPVFYFFIKSTVKSNKTDGVQLDMYQSDVYFITGTFIMGVYAVRNMAYFIIFAGLAIYKWICCQEEFNRPIKETVHHVGKFKLKMNSKNMFIIKIAVIILLKMIMVSPFTDIYSPTPCKNTLDKLLVYTQEQGKDPSDIKLYTSFNDGAYAEWLGFKAYIDPRAEIFLEAINGKENLVGEMLKLNSGKISHYELQEKYGFDYWLVQDGMFNTYLRSDDNYNLVISMDGYKVYQHNQNT